MTMVQSTSDSSVGARGPGGGGTGHPQPPAVSRTHLLSAHPSQPITSDARVPLRVVQEIVHHSFDHWGGASNKNQTNAQYHTVITRESKPTRAVGSKRNKFEITRNRHKNAKSKRMHEAWFVCGPPWAHALRSELPRSQYLETGSWRGGDWKHERGCLCHGIREIKNLFPVTSQLSLLHTSA